MEEAWSEWAEVRVVLRLGVGERQRAERAPVESANKTNDPLSATHVARQLNGRLYRLGS